MSPLIVLVAVQNLFIPLGNSCYHFLNYWSPIQEALACTVNVFRVKLKPLVYLEFILCVFLQQLSSFPSITAFFLGVFLVSLL